MGFGRIRTRNRGFNWATAAAVFSAIAAAISAYTAHQQVVEMRGGSTQTDQLITYANRSSAAAEKSALAVEKSAHAAEKSKNAAEQSAAAATSFSASAERIRSDLDRSTFDVSKSANALAKSSSIASNALSNQIASSRTDQRAWLSFANTDLFFDSSKGEDTLKTVIANSGRTPARSMVLEATSYIVDTPYTDEELDRILGGAGPKPLPKTYGAIAPAAKTFLSFNITNTAVMPQPRTGFDYVFLKLTYTTLNEVHTTSFCGYNPRGENGALNFCSRGNDMD